MATWKGRKTKMDAAAAGGWRQRWWAAVTGSSGRLAGKPTHPPLKGPGGGHHLLVRIAVHLADLREPAEDVS